jgi:hypothetical protein
VKLDQLINATPRRLCVYDARGLQVILDLPEPEIYFHVGGRVVTLSDGVVSGVIVPVFGTAYQVLTALDHSGNEVDLPPQRDGVFYVVTAHVAIAASHRTDFLCPGETVFPAPGRPRGCRGLLIPHHPAAANPGPRAFDRHAIAELIARVSGTTADWEAKPPASLFYKAFGLGLISQDEVDAGRLRYPGEAWHRAGT